MEHTSTIFASLQRKSRPGSGRPAVCRKRSPTPTILAVPPRYGARSRFLFTSSVTTQAHRHVTLPLRPRGGSRRVCPRRHRCAMDESLGESGTSARPQRWGDLPIFCRMLEIYWKEDYANCALSRVPNIGKIWQLFTGCRGLTGRRTRSAPTCGCSRLQRRDPSVPARDSANRTGSPCRERPCLANTCFTASRACSPSVSNGRTITGSTIRMIFSRSV